MYVCVIVITPGLIWRGLSSYDVSGPWWGALLPVMIESAALPPCLPLGILHSSPAATGIYCFKCHRSWYDGWEERMGLLGSIVTVRFGELCSLSDPAEPLALRALKCSHTFLNVIVASHVPECTRSCFRDLVFFFHLRRSKPSDISHSGAWRCRTCQPILEFIFLESK